MVAWKAACCMARGQMTHELPPKWWVHECGYAASVAEPRMGVVRHVREAETSPRERDVSSVTM
jgi:hypothetical protein